MEIRAPRRSARPRPEASHWPPSAKRRVTQSGLAWQTRFEQLFPSTEAQQAQT